MPRFNFRPRFSLRTLLIVVAVLAVPLTWVGWQWRIVQERKAMLAEIEVAKNKDPFSMPWFGNPREPKDSISWYRKLLGDQDVPEISVPNSMRDRQDQIQAVFPESYLVLP